MRSMLVLAALTATAAAAPQLRATEPEILGGDVFELRGYLQIHGAELGGRADERDPFERGHQLGFMLFDDNAEVVGAAVVTRGAKAYEVVTQRVRFDPAAAIKRFEGTRITTTTSYGRGVPLDCAMGGRPCSAKPVRRVERAAIASAETLSAQLMFQPAHAPRLVVCVDVAPEAVELEGLEVLAIHVAGFPTLFDATSGARVGAGPVRCVPTN